MYFSLEIATICQILIFKTRSKKIKSTSTSEPKSESHKEGFYTSSSKMTIVGTKSEKGENEDVLNID